MRNFLPASTLRVRKLLRVNDGAVSAAIITATSTANALAVVSDHTLSVAALTALLVGEGTRRLTQTARGEEEVATALLDASPGLILVEGSWPAWPAVLHAEEGRRRLALLDPEDDPANFVPAVRAGAEAYLARSASLNALEAAMVAVGETGYYLDPILAGKVIGASERAHRLPVPLAAPQLSERELEILARVATGQSSKEIAREYAITAKTVCNHVSNIYAKLNVRHRGELVLYAVANGLTPA